MFEENIMPTKPKTVTVSSYLTKHFKSNSDIDWEKLKTQVIGLPVNERLLVNKVNVENIIWQEVINSGNIGIGFDYYNSGTANTGNSEQNFLKLLADSSRKDIQPFVQFVIRFAEKKLQELKQTDPSFWMVLLVLSKTERWRNIAERVLDFKEEDIYIEGADKSDNTSRSGFNEFGNFSYVTPKVTVSFVSSDKRSFVDSFSIYVSAPESFCGDSLDREGS